MILEENEKHTIIKYDNFLDIKINRHLLKYMNLSN